MSIAPQRLVRAMLLQVLFRWLVGLPVDDAVAGFYNPGRTRSTSC